MAVAFGSVGTYGTNSAVCGKPAGTAVGDLLVIVWEDDIARTTASLAGWTALTPTTWNAAGRTIGILWKIATATEVAATTFTVTNVNSGTYGEAVCFRYTGPDGTAPIDVSKNDADTSTASSITTATANEIQLVAIAWDSGANTAAAPSGFTARLNPGTGDFYIADRVVASAGATATADFSATGTAGPKGIIQIAIKAPGGATVLPPPTFATRRRQTLRTRRPQYAAWVPPQVTFTLSPYVQRANRRPGRPLPGRRGRSTFVVPTQTAPVNPAYPPQTAARARRLITVRRGRSAQLLADQQTPPPVQQPARRRFLRLTTRPRPTTILPAEQPPAPTGRRRIAPPVARRGRTAEVVPTQTAPVNPTWVPRPVAFARRILARRRKLSVDVVPPQVTFTPVTYVQRPPRMPPRTLPTRRGRSTFVVPTQTAPIAPAYVPQASTRARRLLTVRRGRSSVDVITQSAPPTVQQRGRARLLPTPRRRAAQHIAGQHVPPPIQQAARARRAPAVRRNRSSNPVPAQATVIAPRIVALIPARARRMWQKVRRRWAHPPFENTVSPFQPPTITGPLTTTRPAARTTTTTSPTRTTTRTPVRTTKGNR